MFGKTKMLNATCVIPLTDRNIEMLKKMQMNHPIPEEAFYIAFLEDGDACFLEELEFGPGITMPLFHMFTFYEDIKVEI